MQRFGFIRVKEVCNMKLLYRYVSEIFRKYQFLILGLFEVSLEWEGAFQLCRAQSTVTFLYARLIGMSESLNGTQCMRRGGHM